MPFHDWNDNSIIYLLLLFIVIVGLIIISSTSTNNNLHIDKYTVVKSEENDSENINSNLPSLVTDITEHDITLNTDDYKNVQAEFSSLELSLTKPGFGYNLDQVEKHISQTTSMCDPRLCSFTCIDGRSDNKTYQSPGGDIGEFILAVQIYRNECDLLQIKPLPINDLFLNFVINIDPEMGFYMHTDGKALVYTLKQLGLPITTSYDFSELPENKQHIFLSLLKTDPNVYGCAHLKYALTKSSDYKTTSDVVYETCQAYFKFMWRNDSGTRSNLQITKFDELSGIHDEKAILIVTTTYLNGINFCSYLVPRVAPLTNVNIDQRSSVYVYNYTALFAGIRRRLSVYFSNVINNQVGHATMNAAKFMNFANTLGNIQLNATISNLAPTLPQITANFIVN